MKLSDIECKTTVYSGSIRKLFQGSHNAENLTKTLEILKRDIIELKRVPSKNPRTKKYTKQNKELRWN